MPSIFNCICPGINWFLDFSKVRETKNETEFVQIVIDGRRTVQHRVTNSVTYDNSSMSLLDYGNKYFLKFENKKQEPIDPETIKSRRWERLEHVPPEALPDALVNATIAATDVTQFKNPHRVVDQTLEVEVKIRYDRLLFYVGVIAAGIFLLNRAIAR